jgi:hypothetical protein
VATNRESRRIGADRVAIVISGVLVVAVAIGVGIWKSSSSAKTAAGPNLCTAIASVASYNTAHPPKHTYPDLKATLSYAEGEYSIVSPVPSSEAHVLATAVGTLRSMITVIDRIERHDKFTVAQDKASFNDILVWRKTASTLSKWQKAHCSR